MDKIPIEMNMTLLSLHIKYILLAQDRNEC